jgi:hypothetical protein
VGVTFFGVDEAAVGDEDRPVCQAACGARGLDGDLGGYPGDPDSVDARPARNAVKYRAVERVGRLSTDDGILGPGRLRP